MPAELLKERRSNVPFVESFALVVFALRPVRGGRRASACASVGSRRRLMSPACDSACSITSPIPSGRHRPTKRQHVDAREAAFVESARKRSASAGGLSRCRNKSRIFRVIPCWKYYAVRSASAFLTAALASNAPSTFTDRIVARASAGDTDASMRARPTTRRSSVRPAALSRSSSSRSRGEDRARASAATRFP